MTTYPFDTYAAGWGTSFSTPLVSGASALMISAYQAQPTLSDTLKLAGTGTETQAANALTHSQAVANPQMGHGRLDIYQAMQAWRTSLSLH
jgi:subtilisin family serine protease